MNPLKYLSPALYARLASALVLETGSVPVFEHLAGNTAGHYVLLQQPTHTPLSFSPGCRGWSCTVLVDVITQFPTNSISSEPADELLDQISELLDGQRLNLPDGWDCGPATFEPSGEVRELTGELVAVHRLIRYRWDVFRHASPAPLVLAWPFGSGFPIVFA